MRTHVGKHHDFSFTIPVTHEGEQVATIEIVAIAYLYRCDGTLRDVDINHVYFNGSQAADLAGYVSAADPGKYDEWLKYAREEYLTRYPEEPARNVAE